MSCTRELRGWEPLPATTPYDKQGRGEGGSSVPVVVVAPINVPTTFDYTSHYSKKQSVYIFLSEVESLVKL